MPFDEDGREYKECEYAHCHNKRFYRDDDKYKSLNDYNWDMKKFCCYQHKRDAHNIFRESTNPFAFTMGDASPRRIKSKAKKNLKKGLRDRK